MINEQGLRRLLADTERRLARHEAALKLVDPDNPALAPLLGCTAMLYGARIALKVALGECPAGELDALQLFLIAE